MALKKAEKQGFVMEPRETYAELVARHRVPPEVAEQNARETAIKFGVDPDLPPKERFFAVAKRVRVFGKPAQEPIPREPGSDFEEDAA